MDPDSPQRQRALKGRHKRKTGKASKVGNSPPALCRPFRAQNKLEGLVTTGSIPAGHYTHGNMTLPRPQR